MNSESRLQALLLTAVRHEQRAILHGFAAAASPHRNTSDAKPTLRLPASLRPEWVRWQEGWAACVCIGVGPNRSRHSLELLLDAFDEQGVPVPRVILAGFSGGLSPDLVVGDVVVADRVMEEDAESLGHHRLGWVPEIAGTKVGAVVSTDGIVATVEAKRLRWERTAALAVDMESSSVAEVMGRRRAGVPFAVVRVISDAWDEVLPAELLKALKPEGGIDWWRFSSSLLSGPSYWRVLARLGRSTKRAGQQLARALKQLQT